MKNILIIATSIYLLFVYASTSYAMFDPRTVPNNKVGVHILDPNEIGSVSDFVNNNGGDWGYVTVPIQPSDRDQTKWQTFLHTCKDKHLIPIIRITTIPLGGTWDTARDTDLVDFANFLNELEWPIENRYIVLFNEVNRDQEWGGTVDPAAYARIVKNAYTIFKERSRDFYMLGPALDSALPNSKTSMSAANYLLGMQQEDPAIWSYIDGWASHSYPNPAFSASPSKTGMQSIVSYKTETSNLRIAPKPVFITETGWDQRALPATTIESYWRQAFNKWSLDRDVVAVTPFVLQGGEQFAQFSFFKTSGELNPTGNAIKNLTKTKGEPPSAHATTSELFATSNQTHTSPGDKNSTFFAPSMLIRFENFFRSLIGLQHKQYMTVGTANLTVEVANSAREWEKGLSGRDSLERDTGMLFQFPREHVPIFWMKDMKFPIDIIWIKEGKILAIDPDVPPPSGTDLPTYSPPIPVDTVLEVPAGYAKSHGWVEGSEVIFYD